MKKTIAISLLSIIMLALLSAGSTAARAASPGVDVIVVFNSPVTQDDVRYLQGLGGVIKYTYTIIDGVAANLPQAALDKLRSLKDSPGSDPVAGRIKYIENDGVMYALDDGGASAGHQTVAIEAAPVNEPVQTSPVSAPETATHPGLLQAAIDHLVKGDIHVFPVLPLAT